MNDIQKNWHKGKVVMLNGITFSNHEIFLFDISDLKLNKQFHFKKKIIMDDYIIDWCDILVQEELSIPDTNQKIIIGSGGLGSDGVIALTSKEKGLIWSIFSDSTNGFINIKYIDINTILVESGSGYNYNIPIDAPLKLKRLHNKSPIDSQGKRTTYPPYPMPK